MYRKDAGLYTGRGLRTGRSLRAGVRKKRVSNDLIPIPHRGWSLRTVCGDSDPYHGLHCCTSTPRRSVLVSNWPMYYCQDRVDFFSLFQCFPRKWKTIPTHPNRPTYVNPTRAKPRTNHKRRNDRNQLDSTKHV